MENNDNLRSGFKYNRVLTIFSELISGKVVNKSDEAKRFGVTERSIQRDIDDLKCFFADNSDEGGLYREVKHSKKLKGYYLEGDDTTVLNKSEILAVCKILLASRAFTKSEMKPIINKIVNSCVSQSDKEQVKRMVANEMHHYIELSHHKKFVGLLWDIGEAVQKNYCMEIEYTKQDGRMVKRVVHPVGIMFSEFYFYLAAFIEKMDPEKDYHYKNDPNPTIYRIDRIQSFKVLRRKFPVIYKERFEEGLFRKRIQFMIGGPLRKVKFLYKGKNVEAILDRLPTAKIVGKTDEGIILNAECYGDGIDMWFGSQLEAVEVIDKG